MIGYIKNILSALFVVLSLSLSAQPVSPIYQTVAGSGSQSNSVHSFDVDISQIIDFSFCHEDSSNFIFINIPFINQGLEIVHEILFTVYDVSNQIVCQHLWSGVLVSGANSNILVGPISYSVGMQTFRVVSQTTINGEEDQNPSNDTAIVNAERFPQLVFNPLPDLALCPNVNAPVSAMPGFTSYQWSTGGSQNVEYFSDSGAYSVTYTNYYGCTVSDTFKISRHREYEAIVNEQIFYCENDSVQELALGGFVQYSWSNGGTQQLAVFSQPGVYTVTVLDSNDCSTIDTISVNEVQLPKLELDSVYFYCENDSITISPINNALNLIWDGISSGNSKNYTQPGQYNVSAIGAHNCIVHKSFEVVENKLPNPNLGEDTILCEGENKQLFAGAFSQYSWNTGSQSQIITVNQAGLYVITVTDSNGCVNSSEINLRLISIQISELKDTILCEGDAFNVLPTGNFDFYQWNDGLTIGLNRMITQPGVYTLNTSLGGKCYKTASFEVIGKTTPLTDFSSVNTGAAVQFYNLSTLYDSLYWSFGDNTTSSDKDPVHVYPTDGVYTVKLTTKNVCGFSYLEKVVTINSLSNNQNLNEETTVLVYPNPAKDVIKVKSNYLHNHNVRLYDITGKLLLEKRMKGNAAEIDINVEHVSKGVYVISIWSDEKVISNQKLIIE